jgi:hypothetical protein
VAATRSGAPINSIECRAIRAARVFAHLSPGGLGVGQVEEGILSLLAERESLAVEQIGAHLGADLDQVLAALHAMRERGLVEALALTCS